MPLHAAYWTNPSAEIDHLLPERTDVETRNPSAEATRRFRRSWFSWQCLSNKRTSELPRPTLFAIGLSENHSSTRHSRKKCRDRFVSEPRRFRHAVCCNWKPDRRPAFSRRHAICPSVVDCGRHVMIQLRGSRNEHRICLTGIGLAAGDEPPAGRPPGRVPRIVDPVTKLVVHDIRFDGAHQVTPPVERH